MVSTWIQTPSCENPKKMIAAAVTAAALSMAASTAMAGTLTNVSVALSDSRVSQPTDVTIRYTIAIALDANDGRNNLLIANFDGLDMTNGSCGSDVKFTVNGATLPLSAFNHCDIYSGKSVQFRLGAGGFIPAGSNVEIVIDKARVTTNATPGSYGAAKFQTAFGSGDALDEPADLPAYTITNAPPPAPVPTLTEWAMILLTAALGGFAALTVHKRRRTV